MKAPLGSPAESAGALYFRTDISPEQIFQAIGRLRREARDEIDRLIRFLDETDNHMEREPDDEGDSDCDREDSFEDDEPDLGSLDGHNSQECWAAGGSDDLRARRRRVRRRRSRRPSGAVRNAGLAARGAGMKIQPWHRKHAVQMVCALPEDLDDALIVLKLAGELVTDFLAEPEEVKRPATVVLIGGNECA